MNENKLEILKEKIIKILKRNKVVRAGIFGSYARGEEKKNSDIDILVEIGAEKFSLLDFSGLKIELEEELNKKVDLVEYCVINSRVKEQILNEEVKII